LGLTSSAAPVPVPVGQAVVSRMPARADSPEETGIWSIRRVREQVERPRGNGSRRVIWTSPTQWPRLENPT
ncbi:MAG: hypothetical protein HY718_10615, partial [Planctomycetes bacterium]|nr:hypothetical protein [Planctomycetota bacterium]